MVRWRRLAAGAPFKLTKQCLSSQHNNVPRCASTQPCPVPDRKPALGDALRAQRRARRLSLRDLSDEIGVSFNTLSRVERGHVPDLENYRRIAMWLDIPTESFLEPASSTPEVITRHLRADKSLSADAAESIASIVQEM